MQRLATPAIRKWRRIPACANHDIDASGRAGSLNHSAHPARISNACTMVTDKEGEPLRQRKM